MRITFLRVASSSLRLKTRRRLTGADGFFATIRASASLSSTSAVNRSDDVVSSAASRLAVGFFVFPWVATVPVCRRMRSSRSPCSLVAASVLCAIQHKTEYVAVRVMLRICDWVLSHRRLASSKQHNASAFVLNELAQARASLLTDAMTDRLKADGLFDKTFRGSRACSCTRLRPAPAFWPSSWSAIRTCA